MDIRNIRIKSFPEDDPLGLKHVDGVSTSHLLDTRKILPMPPTPAQLANKRAEGLTEAQILQAQINALATLLFEGSVIPADRYSYLLIMELEQAKGAGEE